MLFYCQLRRQLTKIVKRSYSFKLAHLSEHERLTLLRTMALPKSRPDPIILKLDTPEFQSILTAEVQSLASMFKKYNYEIRVAGGAVRDLLMGLRPKDLDFATTATPSQMKDMFTSENVRMINMNGEKHGTITPRINDLENFEVTTLRIDVVTDGRHAEVQFTQDWMLDALRRDLTINSMFLGLDGSVYDYFYGYDDLKSRTVRFVGDPVTRIQEDYLRILRYFRFYGRIAENPDNHEESTIKAIVENRQGLENISGERIWTELKKTLEGNFAGNLLKKIVECKLAPCIGLPENPNLDELEKVWARSQNLKLHPMTLLASLLNTVNDAINLNARLKLSAFERELALFVVENRFPEVRSEPLRPYQKLVMNSRYKTQDAFKYVTEVLKYQNSPYLEDFEKWQIPTFPVNGKMLKEKGVEAGKFMGLVLNELKLRWVDSGFSLTADQLLQDLPDVVTKLSAQKRRR